MNPFRICFAILLPALLIGIAACSGGETLGDGISTDAPEVSIREAITDPELRRGQITLEGTIVSICPSRGCWLYLRDDTGQIVVDLAPNDMAIPRENRSPGAKTRVSGMLQEKNGQVILEATGVEVY